MISNASRGGKLLVNLLDVNRALEWLIEAEIYMPDIFKSMSAGGDSKIIEDTWHFLYETYMRGKKSPVPEYKLVTFLQNRTPAHNIVRIIEVMEKSKMLKKQHLKGVGIVYTPENNEMGMV